MENSNPKEQNEYAKNVKGDPVFILDAESGRKGYWCMGCEAEMEAVRRKKNLLHKSYFRHIVKDAKKGEIPCSFSNKDFRHNLAIDILQRTKRIKVPNLYKYAPDGKTAKLIQEASFIDAHSVKAELTFYEDDNGKVLFGKNPDIDNKNLLIRPDVTFFDKDGLPILLIEIVVSHKLNDDKKAKIRRLGIDTIQVIIPKDSQENIAKNFLVTKNTKWVFNHVEQNTNYFQLPAGHTEGISQIDELQMGLLGESIICRKNQISNLIRSITRCVGSQLYKRVEFNIGQEISRIEKAAREHQSRLDEIQAGIESEIYSELGNRRDELDKAEEGFQKNHSDLEGRYNRKRNQLREEQEDTNREIVFRERAGNTETEIRRKFDREERECNYQETDIDSEQEVIRRQETDIIRDIEENAALANNFTGEEEFLRGEFESFEKEEQENFERIREDLESKISGYREFKTKVEIGIRSEFEREYQQIVERVNNRDLQGGDELSERIKSILELRGLFGSYSNGKETLERYRKGIEFIKNDTWKEWNR
ncbi:conserved hypothetical protein [Flavobacterium psychrophilum]|uniref:hypothetical protein n=1 Tax=Flavobacterium psychrophilum TaxID=96345 RepID=UPI000B7C12E4|nr:hypothetical protein [Flavobacterium psychrophilum]SNB23878.1 conserved hypothetical protein [Flavobacterium psychrophilum]